jgi:hypothetical protein
MVPKRALDEVLILYKSNKLLLNLFSFQTLNLSAILCSLGCLPQITEGQHSGGQLQLPVDSLSLPPVGEWSLVAQLTEGVFW